jgi:hypothetical protein
MLADMLELPAWTKGNPTTGACVMQAHWIKNKGGCHPIVLHRDVRDVMVSYYYHSFFLNEFQNMTLVQAMRQKFEFADYDDIRANLLPFMKVMIENPTSPKFSWLTFVEAWMNSPVTTSYEVLRRDTAKELQRLSTVLIGETISAERAQDISQKYSMENMRKIKASLNPGVLGKQKAELSFIRKGSVGGWTDAFSDEALHWLESRTGATLEKLGYQLGRPNDDGINNG